MVELKDQTKTDYVLFITFDLYEGDEEICNSGKILAHLVKSNDYKIGTGFARTTEALVLSNQSDAAYKMLKQSKCPSWLYPVSMGATTIWERWDSMLPNGSINPGGMTSFNHYTLDAVTSWMNEQIGGLKSLELGYEIFFIQTYT